MNNYEKRQTDCNGNKVLVAVFIFSLILTGTQIGCSSTKTPESMAGQKASAGPVSSTPAKQASLFKIAILSDRSGSVDSTRTPFISMAQLEELIGFLRKNSGEIAFGFIDDDSNQPFQRLRIEPRPPAPVPPIATNNPYEQEKLLNQYIGKMKAFKSLYREWQAETSRRVETFKNSVQPMIDCLHDQSCRSGSTDVFEGLRRADLFLAESEVTENQNNILVLITDGLETAKPKSAPPSLASRPLIIVVNGSASLGVLKSYRIEAVEGIDAAIRQITRLQADSLTASTAVLSETSLQQK